MKSKDLNTIGSFLKKYKTQSIVEYPTPVGKQVSGTMAKATAAAKKSVTAPSKSPTLKSTVSTALSGSQPEQAKLQRQQASKIEPGAVAIDQSGQEVEIVGGAGGNTNKPETVVAKDKSGNYVQLDPNTELDIPVEESKVGKILDKNLKKHNLHRKIKRLVRKKKLDEQGEELLFEINFNDPKIAKAALDLPIKCGFEAETSWDSVYGDSDDEDSDWIDEYNWYDLEDMVYDQDGSRAVNRIEESYNEWISDKAMDEEADYVWEIVGEREEDEYYLNDYIESELSEDDIEEYKERILDDLPEEDQDEYADWDFMNWGRQYVEEELLDEYKEWLADGIRDEGEAMDRALEDVRDRYDMDEWASYEYGSWQSCLYEHDIYLSNPDGGEGRGQEEVGEYIENWAADNSTTTSVQSGEYHAGYGDTKQNYWRVEGDPSISTSGTGSEIISPVYSTPRKMLEEMKSLFAWLEDQDVDTNSSTGLHVTMSYTGEQRKPVNRVKLAVLLGDKYLLSTFGRENNSYARSQYKNLEKAAVKLKRNPQDIKTIKQIESILDGGISHDKYSAINFKDGNAGTDRETENKLIEFRIGGGDDYHRNFNTAAKAVIRYATTMHAAHNEDEYNKDYATALFRLISKIGKISADDEERVKDRINPDVDAPAVDVLKDYFSKDNYVEHLRNLVAAYNTLAEYHALKNQTNEDESGPDQARLQELLTSAQRYFAGAIMQAGYDFSQGHNRATPNAKSIGILRKALKDFELDYDTLGQMILAQQDRLDLVDERRSDLKPKQIIGRIKNGVNKLFKKGIVEEPEYITASQVEKVIQGMWNAVNSGELSDGQQSITFVKHLAAASGMSDDAAAAKLDELVQQSNRREYKTFHRRVMQGSGYNTDPLFSPGTPVNTKLFNRFLEHLKQYPEWDHPVAAGHNPGVTGDDSYQENAVNKMMQKMRLRFEHLEDIRETDPGLYFDSMREVAKLVQDLIDANSTADDTMSDIDDSLHGTEHAHNRDGHNYFGMTERQAERLQQTVKQIDRPDPFSEPAAHSLRDNLQDYIGGSLTRHYELKARSHPGFFKIGILPDLIRERTKAIQEFLTGFDKIAQKLGFDSQQSAIDKKLKLDKKQAKFNKKHGPEYLAKVDGFEFGGNIFVSKAFHDDLGQMTDRALVRELEFSNNMHRSDMGAILVIPNAHYFTALDAKKVLENGRYKGTWRESLANRILEKFYDIYKVAFVGLEDRYVDINDYGLKGNLKDRDVAFTDKLGDGRIGMGQFAPLLPKEELNGPHGEPFSPTSAVSWKLNNPELAKKVDADEKKREKEKQNYKGLLKAAGVEDYESHSSSSIADNTSWGDLADHLKLPRGVGDQGVNLLNRIYDKYDNDHNWRPEPDPNVCCAPRWAAAVKAAKAYIERNYIHSGGNYFRKNADGSIGDDVSGVYRNDHRGDTGSNTPAVNFSLGELDSVELTDTSYAEARGNYELFDGMMQNGIGYYIVQADANRLVKFLVGDFSEQYKRAVLKALAYNQERGGEPADIQQALALGRNNMESVFDKFDKLPLAEQLRIIAKVDKQKIDEAWSKKYKDSINCSNPKGFSQKAHCAGKKKKVSERPLTKGEEKDKEKYVKGMKKSAKDFKKRYGKDAEAVMYATATKMAKEAFAEGAVPVHNVKRDYEKIMSEPLLGSDLRGQMNAYFVVPDPEMIHAFRERIAQAGSGTDLRNIFKDFAKKQLHPTVKKVIAEAKLSEAKGLFGRNAGDKFVHTDGREYAIVHITAYPDPQTQRYDSPEQRDEVIAKIEAEYDSKIEWVNTPNKGMLAFGIATLDDADGGHVHWGKYLQFSKHDMLGTWSNNQVPAGWKLATKGAQKLQAGYDPQHLIKTENVFASAEEVINTVASNSPEGVKEMFVGALNSLNQGQGSIVFEGMWPQQEAIRDYFGEIMQPVALMGGVIKGDAEEARRVLAGGAEWSSCKVMFPMAMNAALCDSFMIAPNGQEIGISTKGGSGAKASAKNLYDAAKKAETEGNTDLLDAHKFTVDVVTMVHEQSAKDGPVILGEYLGIDGIDQNLQAEINKYMANGKSDLNRISKQARKILSPYKVQLSTKGFNAGYAILSAVAKTVAAKINENPEFTKGALALLNQSSIVQIYTKMGKKGEDAVLGQFKAVYPPNFKGVIIMDGGKNYYSTRVGGKLAFGFD